MGAGAIHGQKAEKPGPAPLLKMEYAPALPPPGRSHGVRAFVFGRDAFDLPGGHQISGAAV